MLARQIANGAPYDVFLSASRSYAEQIVREGHGEPGSVFVYGLGRLGIWSATAKVTNLEDLRSAAIGRVAIANPQHAPYGLAARQALEKAGLWEKLNGRLVYAENVRQAVQIAESGNVDAAIASWTLLRERNGHLLPEHLHAPIEQTAVIMAASRRKKDAARFLAFLRTPEARSLLASHGIAAAR